MAKKNLTPEERARLRLQLEEIDGRLANFRRVLEKAQAGLDSSRAKGV